MSRLKGRKVEMELTTSLARVRYSALLVNNTRALPEYIPSRVRQRDAYSLDGGKLCMLSNVAPVVSN
jgi:hypothetical protein